ncbi:MAG TPA: hypothetical protein VHB21_21430, partial [Minicystis sp.]|nr:hypothetical protein [Minicystis sp.]
ADIGLSDVFADSCDFDVNGVNSDVKDNFGPVQAMGFIVPHDSSQQSISYDAAYLVYGIGPSAKVSPWDDMGQVFERDYVSGTQRMIARTLQLDPQKLRGTVTQSSSDEAALVACAPDPDKAIGILAVDLVQSNRASGTKLLAYQHAGQSCGYLPDSTATSNDKANVRDGHYFIWGPIHMFTHKQSVNPNAQSLIDYVSGVVPPPAGEGDIFDYWAKAHLVPQCAMRVSRETDGGDLHRVMPTHPCSCRYELAATGKTSCPRCANTPPAECPVCSADGYCEPP